MLRGVVLLGEGLRDHKPFDFSTHRRQNKHGGSRLDLPCNVDKQSDMTRCATGRWSMQIDDLCGHTKDEWENMDTKFALCSPGFECRLLLRYGPPATVYTRYLDVDSETARQSLRWVS